MLKARKTLHQIIRVERIHQLPPDIQTLRAESDRDGISIIGRLTDEWASGVKRFDGTGEALFAAFSGDTLLGIGGVTIEPDARVNAMRMRRLYVLSAWRKQGVGRALAEEMMKQGFAHARLLTCNARATPAAAKFWETMGFVYVAAEGWTHEMK